MDWILRTERVSAEMTAKYEFRVQFVDDVDPFNVLASVKHAEPTVPKRFSFVSDLPLYDQVPGLKKHLRAPHKVDLRIHNSLVLVDCKR